MASKLAPRFAKSHWVKFKDGKHFTESPVATRGVPHCMIPGVHASLEKYGDALETLRRHTKREDAQTVDSLMCLPYSAWTQALAPVIEATADLSMRLCVRDPQYSSISTGRAYLPDATSEEEAIVREPLLRRPSQTSVNDNPFATSYKNIDTFFNAACHLSLMCKDLDGRFTSNVVDGLWKTIDNWIMGSAAPGPWIVQASDAVLLLCVMYPCTWKINEKCILECFAKACPQAVAAFEAAQTGVDKMLLHNLLEKPELLQAQKWWSAFRRHKKGDPQVCAWKSGVAPLIKLLEIHDGSHYVTTERCEEVRNALERAVQSAFLVHSEDGYKPPPAECPASAAKCPAGVRRPMIDPIFVGNEERGIEARGCLVGLKPFQYRQIANLALGAGCVEVECQVFRNEGGLNLRISSAADILDKDGLERSAKSLSPVQVEGNSWSKWASYLYLRTLFFLQPLTSARVPHLRPRSSLHKSL